jgi:hypothetical protein
MALRSREDLIKKLEVIWDDAEADPESPVNLKLRIIDSANSILKDAALDEQAKQLKELEELVKARPAPFRRVV